MDTLIASTASQFDAFELLRQVDAFYNTAWQHLLIYTTILLAMVGIVIPIIIQIIQRRSQKREEAALNEKIEALVDKEKSSLQLTMRSDLESYKKELSSLISQFDEKIKEASEGVKKLQEESQTKLRDELQKQINRALGVVFHAQGYFLSKQGDHAWAVESLVDAVEHELTADDHGNLRRALSMMIADCLPNIDKESLKKMPRTKEKMPRIIEALTKQNARGEYTDVINSLRMAYEEASERKKDHPK